VLLDELHRVRQADAFDLAEWNLARPPRREHVGERRRADREKPPAQPALVKLRALAEEERAHERRGEHHPHAVTAEREQHLCRVLADSEGANALQHQQHGTEHHDVKLLRQPRAIDDPAEEAGKHEGRDEAALLRDERPPERRHGEVAAEPRRDRVPELMDRHAEKDALQPGRHRVECKP
jgi:hypothetical protein